MSNKTTQVIYKKIQEDFSKRGYIDLTDKEVNSKEELAEIASIFRDPRYETFRIVYMNDDRIAGYESISTKTPNSVSIVKPNKDGKVDQTKSLNKMLDRMQRLNANGYYLVHNHPSYNAKASRDDIRTTEILSKKIPGFKGHLIVNNETYAWIDIDRFGEGYAENYIPINKERCAEVKEELEDKSIYDVQIKSRDDFVGLMWNIKNEKDYSIAILTDATARVRMVLDIPNKMLNESKEQLNGYFRNIAKQNGAVRVFFATQDEETYKKSKEHLKNGTFKDSFWYKEKAKDEPGILIHEFNDEYSNKELWDEKCKKKKVSEEIEYENFEERGDKNMKQSIVEFDFAKDKELPLELPKVRKGYIRGLYKEVGKEPKVVQLKNNLEAKQELVKGLIEVVGLDDDTIIVCNEEGKIQGMRPNVLFPYDFIAGPMIVLGDDYENGDFKSISREKIVALREMFKDISFRYPDTDKEIEEEMER